MGEATVEAMVEAMAEAMAEAMEAMVPRAMEIKVIHIAIVTVMADTEVVAMVVEDHSD